MLTRSADGVCQWCPRPSTEDDTLQVHHKRLLLGLRRVRENCREISCEVYLTSDLRQRPMASPARRVSYRNTDRKHTILEDTGTLNRRHGEGIFCCCVTCINHCTVDVYKRLQLGIGIFWEWVELSVKFEGVICMIS